MPSNIGKLVTRAGKRALAQVFGKSAERKAGTDSFVDFRDIIAVAPNLHWHYTGITSTIISVVPRQAETFRVAATGPFLPRMVPRVRFRSIVTQGWSLPNGYKCRIWHARRNNEMIIGLLLKYMFRQPWRLVFTSAAQRRHSLFTRWLMGAMDALIATSEGAAAMLDRPSTIIYHGVDTERFKPAERRAEMWKQSGLPGDFGIGVFGRIRPQKGTDLFVKAMIELLPKYPGATAILTGRAMGRHKKFAEKLQRCIAEAGLAERFVFLGEQARSKMPGLFREVSIYVAPMRSEGFGLTPLEAMASGTAVVATRVGAAAHLVSHGKTGALVDPDDLCALIREIEPLLANLAQAETLGSQARKKALDMHDIDVEACRINAIYEALLKAEFKRPQKRDAQSGVQLGSERLA